MRRLTLLGVVPLIAGGLMLWQAGASGSALWGVQTFTIGGAVYTDLDNPIGSGVSGVSINVECSGGHTCDTETTGAQGLWMCLDVPEDTCTVTARLVNYCFMYLIQRISDCSPMGHLTVNEDRLQQNQSIQFLAKPNCVSGVGPGACCPPDGVCSMETREECAALDGSYSDDGLGCDEDIDGDGLSGCDDGCPCSLAPGGVDSEGRPFGDLDDNCSVDLLDYHIFLKNLSGP